MENLLVPQTINTAAEQRILNHVTEEAKTSRSSWKRSLNSAVVRLMAQQMDEARRTRRLIRIFGSLTLLLLLLIVAGIVALGVQNYVYHENDRIEFMRMQGSVSSGVNEIQETVGGDVARLRKVVEGLSGVTAAETVRLMLTDTTATGAPLDSATQIQTNSINADSLIRDLNQRQQ
jgi:hypothetical protein